MFGPVLPIIADRLEGSDRSGMTVGAVVGGRR
jgi:hypothetical protein